LPASDPRLRSLGLALTREGRFAADDSTTWTIARFRYHNDHLDCEAFLDMLAANAARPVATAAG
jgi:hypothetical protein